MGARLKQFWNMWLGLCVVCLIGMAAIAADISRSSGVLLKDQNNGYIDVAPAFSLIDGTADTPLVSPIGSDTSEVPLVFPPKAVHLVVIPTTANARYSKVSGGATLGTFILIQNVGNNIDGVEGDTIYIQRTTTTPIEFVFDMTR